MFPHCNIQKYTWTSPEEKTHNQTNHILTDRRQHSSIFDVQSFRRADCDNDHYLIVAVVRERLAVSKHAAHKMDMQRLNLKKLQEEKVNEQYQVTIINKFTALEDSEDHGDINKAWDTVRENINILAKKSLDYCEFKHHKPWIDDECSK
jgi:hypothetical protein